MGNGYTRNEKEMLGMEGDWGLGIMWNGSWENRETRESGYVDWDTRMGNGGMGNGKGSLHMVKMGGWKAFLGIRGSWV